MQPVEHLPVPYFLIDPNFQILVASRLAREQFGDRDDFLQIVDQESRRKVETYLHLQGKGVAKPLEANLWTARQQLELFELYQRWDEQGQAHVVCLPADRKLVAVTELMQRIREDIHDQRPAVPFERVQAAPVAAAKETPLQSELQMHLSTIHDLVQVVRPDLQEAGKGYYVQLIEQEIEEATALLKKKRQDL